LWKVEAKGARASYLFGTIHLDDDRVLTVPPVVQHAFDRADVFIAELIDNEASVAQFTRSMMTSEPQLPALLDEDGYARLDTLLGEHGVPAQARPHFKPWAALLTLLQPEGMTGLVLDRVLQTQAREKGKRVIALETIDEQIAVFDGMAEETTLDLLRATIATHDETQRAARAIAELYLARDLAGMWRLNEATMDATDISSRERDQFLDRVLYQRNKRFVERLLPLVDRGNMFAAFGALHLYGERGVLAELQRKGVRVTRLY
jgi:uncharacterized protein YbaP (TraB family)